MYFPCVQQIHFRAVSICLESKYKPAKHQYSNIDTVVNFLGFFSDYLETILSLERFWETYSEAVPRVMSILFLLTIFIYLKIINSGCFLDTKFSKEKSRYLGQLVRRIDVFSLGLKHLCLQ